MSDLTYAQALKDLVYLSGWPKADVVAQPSDAAWAAAAYVQKCRRRIEAGDR